MEQNCNMTKFWDDKNLENPGGRRMHLTDHNTY